MDELLIRLARWLSEQPEIQAADKIDGESTVGVELTDGQSYFLSVEEA